MKYVGGKHLHSKAIVKAILEDAPGTNVWIEPFVGSGSVIAQVPSYMHRIGLDANPYAIALLEATRDGMEFPSDVSETDWRECRDSYRGGESPYPPAYTAFVGWGCSYAARWFEGYARNPKGGTNYAAVAKRSVERLRPLIQDCVFLQSPYQEALTKWAEYGRMVNPAETIIFSDPPYAGSLHEYYPEATKATGGPFDHQVFWAWAKARAAEGFHVYATEFTAPDFAVPIWQVERGTAITPQGGKRRNDILYKVIP